MEAPGDLKLIYSILERHHSSLESYTLQTVLLCPTEEEQ